jgi:hypothetical protein
MPRIQAHGELATDQLLAWELSERLTELDFITPRIEEAINANQTEEKKLELAVAEKSVRDLERKKANYETAIGSTESASVILSLTKKLEETDTELAAARSKARVTKRELTASVDPEKAAKQVKEVFGGFADLPLAEQRTILETYVDRIIYNRPVDGTPLNLDDESRIIYNPPYCGSVSGLFDVRLKVFGTEGVENDPEQSNSEVAA